MLDSSGWAAKALRPGCQNVFIRAALPAPAARERQYCSQPVTTAAAIWRAVADQRPSVSRRGHGAEAVDFWREVAAAGARRRQLGPARRVMTRSAVKHLCMSRTSSTPGRRQMMGARGITQAPEQNDYWKTTSGLSGLSLPSTVTSRASRWRIPHRLLPSKSATVTIVTIGQEAPMRRVRVTPAECRETERSRGLRQAVMRLSCRPHR